MKKIEISTDVFAELWSQRQSGEETEDDILRRILSSETPSSETDASIETGASAEPATANKSSGKKSSPRRPF